tara:strand:+ start:260 stop:1477 length:1218 start_codon:yes stop_codon:yes gene_type:complete
MNSYRLYFVILIIFAIAFRLLAIIYFGDTRIENEWGVILLNLETHNVLALRTISGEIIPNIFMPPLYPVFLYFLKLINPSGFDFVNFVLYTQLILSIISIYYFKKLLALFYKTNLTYLGVLVFSLFPLSVYSVSQISSISIQVFLLVIFFYNLFSYIKNRKNITLICFSIFSALLIHLRGEFFIFYFFSLIFILFTNKNITKLILSLIIVSLISSPYLIRNYKIFNVITITESFGYNLWKGNNKYYKGFNLKGVEGNEEFNQELQSKIANINISKKYDLDRDLIFKEEAIKNIKSEPFKYFKFYLKKFISYLFFNFSEEEKYNHLLYIVPKLLISISTLFGILYLIADKKNILNFLSLYYLSNVALFSIFFILPRYSLIILPIQVILSCYFIKKLNIKIFNKILC